MEQNVDVAITGSVVGRSSVLWNWLALAQMYWSVQWLR